MTYPAPRSLTRAAFHTLAVIEHRDPAGYFFVTDGAVSATSLALGVSDDYVADVLSRADEFPAAIRDDVLYHYATNVERGVRVYCRGRSTTS